MGGNVSIKTIAVPFRRLKVHRKRKPCNKRVFNEQEVTKEEAALIRNTWDIISPKRREWAVEIFIRIFELSPQTKALFPFRDLGNEALTQHPMFKGHATRFINAVHSTVNNLDALDLVLIPNLVKLGKTHTDIPGFDLSYLNVFICAIRDVWARALGPQWTHEAQVAWGKVFCLITAAIEDGYNQAMVEENMTGKLSSTDK